MVWIDSLLVFTGRKKIHSSLHGVKRFPSSLPDVDRFPSSLRGVKRFPSSLHGVDRLPSSLHSVKGFPSSQDVFRTPGWLFLYSQWYRACRYKWKLSWPLTISGFQSHPCVFKYCWDNNVTCQFLRLCVFWECLKWVVCELKPFIYSGFCTGAWEYRAWMAASSGGWCCFQHS